MDFLNVISGSSDPVPMEQGAGWIRSDPVQVQDTYYYRQMIQAGSLVVVEAKSATTATTTVTKKTATNTASTATSTPDAAPTSTDEASK